MRKTSTLFLMITGLALLFGIGHVQAQCLAGWQYQRVITIDNSSNSNALTDHEVLLTLDTQTPISNGRMESNGDDIRFTDGTCCNMLCYFIESGINTTGTQVWVRVPSVPANGTVQITMYFGNAGAAAGSDADCTFSFFEGFDGPTMKFSSVCGTTTETLSGGNLDLSWTSSGLLISDDTFAVSQVYTAEAMVNTATGTWPGVYWAENVSRKSYAMLINATQARISVTGGGTDWCSGHNWASTLQTYSGVAGMWSITWEATGSQFGEFPTIGTITSTDATHVRDEDMRLLLGGISSGSGTMNIDWVRARKHTSPAPTNTESGTTPFNTGAPVDVGPDTTVCPGVAVTIDAGSGYTSYLWNTGETTQTIMQDSVSAYWVTVADANGCATSDTMMLMNFTAPVVDLGPDSMICPGSNYTLDAGSGGVTYLWSTGANTQTISVGAAGTYSVTCTDANGCDGMDTVIITVSSGPVLDLGGDTTVCDYDSLVLDAGPGFASYLWGGGSTAQTEAALVTGNYTVTINDSSGCVQTDDINVTVSTSPVAAFTSNPVSDMVTFTDNSTGSPTSWMWDFGDGNSSTMQNPTHTYTASGVYTVCLTATNADGCANTVCQSVTVIIDGIADFDFLSTLNIFPNPANELLMVEMKGVPNAQATLNIFDIEGRNVLQKGVGLSGDVRFKVDVASLDAGTYFMEVVIEGQATRHQFVIMR